MLAWIRTALTLLAGGVGILELVDDSWRVLPGFLLLVLGGIAATVGVARFRRTDDAIRRGATPPTSIAPVLLGGSIAAIAAVLIIASIASGLA